MKINILGGSGLVGHGIFQVLKDLYEVKVFNSSVFDKVNFSFKSDELFKCDLFIHAAGVTDEDVFSDYEYALLKSTKLVNLIVSELKLRGCNKVIYVSSIHVFGSLYQDISSSLLTNPTSTYALFHNCAEKSFEIQMQLQFEDYELLILRVPTIYGFPENINKINRPGIIQFGFLLSLLEYGKIVLRSDGSQYRLFASNRSVGEFINRWIKDRKKTNFTKETLNGQNYTVYDFALLCADRFNMRFHDRNVFVEKVSQVPTNDTLTPIKVVSKYAVKESYLITEYIDDFFEVWDFSK
jgi:nucleoside-diphosphate-sugar epimerase